MTSSPWFRYHANVLYNRRVQDLPGDLFKIWVNALSYACLENVGKSGDIGSIDDVSYALRMKRDDCFIAFQDLVSRGLMVTDGETFQIAKWGDKQYKSDTSTERVRNYRKRKVTVTETAPDTDTDTDTDTDQNPPNPHKGETGSISSSRVKPVGGPFDIIHHLTDREIETLKTEFRGWDFSGYLVREYNSGIRSGQRQEPRAPFPAFRAWCTAWTKDRKP